MRGAGRDTSRLTSRGGDPSTVRSSVRSPGPAPDPGEAAGIDSIGSIGSMEPDTNIEESVGEERPGKEPKPRWSRGMWSGAGEGGGRERDS